MLPVLESVSCGSCCMAKAAVMVVTPAGCTPLSGTVIWPWACLQPHRLVAWHFMGYRSQGDCNVGQRVVLHVSCQSQLHVDTSNVNTPAA